MFIAIIFVNQLDGCFLFVSLFRIYIGCSVCWDWFHPECIGLDSNVVLQMVSYICPKCRPPAASTTNAPSKPSENELPERCWLQTERLLRDFKVYMLHITYPMAFSFEQLSGSSLALA
jgi:hypothetical protein